MCLVLGEFPHGHSFVTWERAEETEATIQVKQPQERQEALQELSPNLILWDNGTGQHLGSYCYGNTSEKHLELCSADPGTDHFTVYIYICNTTGWEEGAVKAWIGWSITDQIPQTALSLLVLFLSPWVNCVIKEAHYSKYILLPYNANQHGSEHESVFSTCNKYF